MCLLVVLRVCESGGAHRHRPQQLRQLLSALAARPLRPAPRGRRDHAPAPGRAPGVHRAELRSGQGQRRLAAAAARSAQSGGGRILLCSTQLHGRRHGGRHSRASPACDLFRGLAEHVHIQVSFMPQAQMEAALSWGARLTSHQPRHAAPIQKASAIQRPPPQAKGAVERAGRGSGR